MLFLSRFVLAGNEAEFIVRQERALMQDIIL
jgi:hypothetical protein